ncbi:hypothetical protein pEaSNUABM6_00050 [Erwinia phage pEa_SNUABM_6]|nr:hypothetical protein pEaSNUABM6_00050 [Erwinia phage pEa_SNUABM_6]
MLISFVTLGEVIPSLDSQQRKLMQDYTEYLRNHADTQDVATKAEFAWPEIHSFYAYCKLAEIQDNQVYPIMLINGISNPMDFTPEKYPTLRIPSPVVIENILNTITT